MTDEITRGTTISAREMITALVGEWNGTYRLWLEPGELRTEGPTRCTGQSVLEGRFVALDYGWTDGDDPQLGSMLLGCTDEGAWEMAWVDTWHTGTSMMFCVGAPDAEVLGSYGSTVERWGWRTRFDRPLAGGADDAIAPLRGGGSRVCVQPARGAPHHGRSFPAGRGSERVGTDGESRGPSRRRRRVRGRLPQRGTARLGARIRPHDRGPERCAGSAWRLRVPRWKGTSLGNRTPRRRGS